MVNTIEFASKLATSSNEERNEAAQKVEDAGIDIPDTLPLVEDKSDSADNSQSSNSGKSDPVESVPDDLPIPGSGGSDDSSPVMGSAFDGAQSGLSGMDSTTVVLAGLAAAIVLGVAL